MPQKGVPGTFFLRYVYFPQTNNKYVLNVSIESTARALRGQPSGRHIFCVCAKRCTPSHLEGVFDEQADLLDTEQRPRRQAHYGRGGHAHFSDCHTTTAKQNKKRDAGREADVVTLSTAAGSVAAWMYLTRLRHACIIPGCFRMISGKHSRRPPTIQRRVSTGDHPEELRFPRESHGVTTQTGQKQVPHQ